MITSLQNEQVKQVVALHKNKGRNTGNEYLIEGKRFIKEAFLRQARIKKIYYTNTKDLGELIEEATARQIPLQPVSEEVMKKMATTVECQGILAVMEQVHPKWEDLKIGQETILLIIDNIQDPGNLGTIFRTALAANVKQIILTKGTVDRYNPKVLRSSMGSIFCQTILTNKTAPEIVNFCRRNNLCLAVSSMEGNSIFSEQTKVKFPLALVIGNEAFGVSDFFKGQADLKYYIPMFNRVESLNAAMAAGIFLYELRRRGGFLKTFF
ncbi:MAG: TrmH family RNA methyltransferase [Desulfitobacteriia bacterium]